jgi:hypothetical protein
MKPLTVLGPIIMSASSTSIRVAMELLNGKVLVLARAACFTGIVTDMNGINSVWSGTNRLWLSGSRQVCGRDQSW